MTNLEFITQLPGKDCGLCGFQTCNELAERINVEPGAFSRCMLLSKNNPKLPYDTSGCNACSLSSSQIVTNWKDSLGRDFDFLLESFPEDPGPREIILPHNPMLTWELEITVGDMMIGRPLGMSCGCPVTHCGVVMDVDKKSGIITWCITGPLKARHESPKDIGYYSAEAYEGLVNQTQAELKIGMRYFFMPRKCMLQWRHSGLINFIQKTKSGVSIRLEGLWIG